MRQAVTRRCVVCREQVNLYSFFVSIKTPTLALRRWFCSVQCLRSWLATGCHVGEP